jgi:small subunit ribosomal protein S9e
MPKTYRNHSKTSGRPRKAFEKERLDSEIKICGEYGLRCKREVWRVQLVLARLRKRARELLTLEENDQRRIFEGQALLRRMFKYGLLNPETENGLDYVLALTLHKLLERRLQTRVLKGRLAHSIHHARVLIYGKFITVANQLCDVASYMVTVENENKIDLQPGTSINGGKPGRRLRKKQASQ